MPNSYKPKIVINQGFSQINPVQCGMGEYHSTHSFGPCIRDYYILHFVTSGKGLFVCNNRTTEVYENQVFVIRPHETVYYEADPKNPWSYIWIGFYSTLELPALLAENDVIIAPYLKELFVNAFDADNIYMSGSLTGAYEHYLCGIIWQIFGRLHVFSVSDIKADMYVNLAISIMKSESRVVIESIAKRMHLSKGYLSRLFKEKCGISPGKYSFNLRMERACELLLSGTNVTDTSRYMGFPDLFAFSRAFKRHFGFSPTEYVKRNS